MFASTTTLLSSIVDYAGLFPPAKLDMPQAMANYARYQKTPYSWMLGRFAAPVSRLSEFEAHLPSLPFQVSQAEGHTRPWPLSLILSGDLEADINRIRAINTRDDIAMTALEFPPLSPGDIEALLPELPNGVDAFFEISPNRELDAYLIRLQHPSASAKIRTGGLTAKAFPNIFQLGQFIQACAEAQVPFKATAGLHHPLPASYRLTYESDSPSAPMHGFLNVAIAAAFSHHHKATAAEVLEILQEGSIAAFQFRPNGISWRHHSLDLCEIESARRNFFQSFGSCSFQEPVDDLKQLRLIS